MIITHYMEDRPIIDSLLYLQPSMISEFQPQKVLLNPEWLPYRLASMHTTQLIILVTSLKHVKDIDPDQPSMAKLYRP